MTKRGAALLLALGTTAGAGAQQPPVTGDGPRGSSERAPGEQRVDDVGYAGRTAAGSGAAVVHRTLPPGSFAEVTALDTGRTILAEVRAGTLPPDRVADLTPAVATALGLSDAPLAPVRVRGAVAAMGELQALRAGRPAAERLPAPEAVLVALRRQLPPPPTGTSPLRAVDGISGQHSVGPPPGARPFRPGPASVPVPPARRATSASPSPAAHGRWVVQIATLSNAARAAQLARTLGGRTQPTGALTRVQLGPFAERAAAERARSDAVRRGYRDAQIIAQD